MSSLWQQLQMEQAQNDAMREALERIAAAVEPLLAQGKVDCSDRQAKRGLQRVADTLASLSPPSGDDPR